MKTIGLTRGLVATVDDSDYDFLSQWRWRASVCHGGKRYAVREDNRGRQVSMHRVLLGATRNDSVDHVDGDGLNNQRQNLRIASAQENNRNRRKSRGSSQFKGVTPVHRAGGVRWRATIKVGRRQISLGTFGNEVEAALVYDAAARHYFGDFAATNESMGLLPPPVTDLPATRAEVEELRREVDRLESLTDNEE